MSLERALTLAREGRSRAEQDLFEELRIPSVSTLPAHRDREQCEWALSLPIDQSPEADTLAWPLYLQPPGIDYAKPIFTGIGDGTLYYGREVRHHRDALTTEHYCSFWFLFYVPESFSGSLD